MLNFYIFIRNKIFHNKNSPFEFLNELYLNTANIIFNTIHIFSMKLMMDVWILKKL